MVLVVETQYLSGWAEVVIVFAIVAEVAGTKKAGVAEVEVGDRNVRPNASLLQSRYVLAGAVLGVTGDLTGVDAPSEDGAPEQIEHGAVLGDLRGCNQSIEDDPGSTPVHDVVNLVAEPAARLCPGHRSGVGIGLRRPRCLLL